MLDEYAVAGTFQGAAGDVDLAGQMGVPNPAGPPGSSLPAAR